MPDSSRPLDVLIVEDDPALRSVLAAQFAKQGWQVRAAGDGDRALELCAQRRPEIVVLDVMLPGRSGIEVCAALRGLYHPSPGVVMVTARDDEVDVVIGLEAGADDYVVKPCRPRELVARVRALARRVSPPEAHAGGRSGSQPPGPGGGAGVLVRGAISVDEPARRAIAAGTPLRLTPTEFNLLALLAREPARVFTRMELLERVWDCAHEGYARNVDCHVTRLRRKIEAAGVVPAPIETVHGVGYCFAAGEGS